MSHQTLRQANTVEERGVLLSRGFLRIGCPTSGSLVHHL